MTDNNEPESTQECVACGYVLAGVGMIIGIVFLYMSIDVLSGGRLTSMLGLGGRIGDDESGD